MLKFTVHGIEVTATDAAEAAKLIRELGKQEIRPEQSWPSGTRAHPIIPPRRKLLNLKNRKNGFDARSVAVEFLTKIRDAGRNGTNAEGLMELLGARHPKGIGSKSASINELIVKNGFTLHDVYDNPRTAEGRIWKAGPKMEAALQTLMRGG